MTNSDYVNQFQDFANSLSSGYLKNWKANSILATLSQLTEIMEDNERFYNYLQSCLEMEGFSRHAIESIQVFLVMEDRPNKFVKG